MSYVSCYTRINWLNKSESLSTPLGKSNLNRMDKAIKVLDDEVTALSVETDTLDTSKANVDQLNSMVVDVSYNDTTGVISLTKYNGTTVNIDTAIEKMAVNFLYDSETEQLVITLEDGSKQYVDMSALVTQYEFGETATISFTVGSDGSVSASVKSGSITKAMLATEVLETVTSAESNASASASSASSSAENASIDAKMSQSYAVGGSGIREGEDSDNSKYYKDLSKSYKDDTQELCENQEEVLSEINKKLSLAEFDIDDDGNLIYTDDTSFDFNVNDNGDLEWEVA